MKAIHNRIGISNNISNTVFNTSNIQNESNSQLTIVKSCYHHNCVQYVKYTK